MRTEIKKSFKWGFFLTEQELRRIILAVTEQAEKIDKGGNYTFLLKAVLKDGAIIESHSQDDLFSIENAGAKRIERIEVVAGSKTATPAWQISISYQDGASNEKSWNSIEFEIVGESRDWAFVTASNLEDRIKRTKIVSWEAIFGNRSSILTVMMISMVLMFLIMPFSLTTKSHVVLQQQYEAGLFKNPIEAIIYLEKFKNEDSKWRLFLFTLFTPGLPVIVFLVCSKILPYLSPSYWFYWGDNIAVYDKRKQRRTIIWTVIVLGAIVSVISGIITKKLGF